MPVLAAAGSLCWPLAVSADSVVIDIENYVVSVGKRANYFDGKFLTADDLNGDQDYKRGTDSLLGTPAQVLGDSTLTLDDLFGAAGRGNVRLIFHCEIFYCISLGEPEKLDAPHLEDLIFLEPNKGTWFGRLYLKGVEDFDDGVYGLSGSFSQFVAVDEPTSTALVGLALVGLCTVRRRRVQRSG